MNELFGEGEFYKDVKEIYMNFDLQKSKTHFLFLKECDLVVSTVPIAKKGGETCDLWYPLSIKDIYLQLISAAGMHYDNHWSPERLFIPQYTPETFLDLRDSYFKREEQVFWIVPRSRIADVVQETRNLFLSFSKDIFFSMPTLNTEAAVFSKCDYGRAIEWSIERGVPSLPLKTITHRLFKEGERGMWSSDAGDYPSPEEVCASLDGAPLYYDFPQSHPFLIRWLRKTPDISHVFSQLLGPAGNLGHHIFREKFRTAKLIEGTQELDSDLSGVLMPRCTLGVAIQGKWELNVSIDEENAEYSWVITPPKIVRFTIPMSQA